MKLLNLQDAVIIVKGWCLTTVPMAATIAGGLATSKREMVFGLPTDLVVLFCAAYGAGFGALSGFLSTDFGKYFQNKSNGLTKPDHVDTSK
jgi:hypothetical protein